MKIHKAFHIDAGPNPKHILVLPCIYRLALYFESKSSAPSPFWPVHVKTEAGTFKASVQRTLNWANKAYIYVALYILAQSGPTYDMSQTGLLLYYSTLLWLLVHRRFRASPANPQRELHMQQDICNTSLLLALWSSRNGTRLIASIGHGNNAWIKAEKGARVTH